MKKLSEILHIKRIDRPDEWSMDDFSRQAKKLEERIAQLEKDLNSLVDKNVKQLSEVEKLKNYLENVKTLSIYVAFHDSAQNVSLKQAKEWLEERNIEQQFIGFKSFCSLLVDEKGMYIPEDYISEFENNLLTKGNK